MIESIVRIARDLGKHTIAEFVSDDETLERLDELGVDYGQGIHIGQPFQISELAAHRSYGHQPACAAARSVAVSWLMAATSDEHSPAEARRLSDELEQWLTSDGEKTLGTLVETFGDKSFAILLVLLLALPALPAPTGGVTHVFEIIAVLIAAQLIAGRDEIWLPDRWRSRELAGGRQERFINSLTRLIRRLERFSRPRLRFIFHHRFSDIVFGLLSIAGTVGAFFAPPFSGLDTLPALGVVVLALSMLLEDALIAIIGTVLIGTGIVLEIVLGAAAIHGISSLL